MMTLERILRLYIICVLVFSAGYAKEKVNYPTYYKSNPSTRFVKFNKTGQVQPSGLSKEYQFAIQAIIPETLTVMAIRVQFQRDNDRNTTGNGWFDFSEGDSMINPPPHDQEYFSNQLRALRDYYDKVSSGKLHLSVEDENGTGFVYPLQSDSVWTLSYEMSYYNQNETEELLDQRLAELFRDAIEIADQNSDIDFSKFDVFIIFHAGVGAEFTQELDTTPNDIPSVFLNFHDLQKTVGNSSPNFKGIAVNNGSFHVKEGIILPETQNQGGYNFFGLVGTAALMMGHQLGLPNLFDTDTGQPGIGRFGLMDQGSGNFFGSIPAQPCAWSKIFLGWEKPIAITSGDSIPVAASLAKNPEKIYKIPINAREYFLIENRQRNVYETRNIVVGYDENGIRIEFFDDGTYSPWYGHGVIVAIDEYDYGLPGSGILIWHIDETVIEQRYAENRVNTDMYHRGIDLVEADGSQDMGHFFNNFGFTGYHSGYAEDVWWNENEVHLWANSSEEVMFTPFTMPSTHAYSKANTGIHITEFSQIDSVMFFSLEIKNYQQGFPAFLGYNSGTSAVIAGDLNSDGQNEIITANQNGKILAWMADGKKFLANNDSTYRIEINGDTTKIPLAVFAEGENSEIPFSPALSDLNHNGNMEVIAGCQNGKLYAWQSTDIDGNGRADLFFEIDCSSPISTVPVIGDWQSTLWGQEIAVGLESGEVCLIRETGEFIWKANISNTGITAISGFVGEYAGLIATDEQNTIFFLDENGKTNWRKSLDGYGSLNYPAVGDLNNNDQLEIIISSQQGYLIILDHIGNLLPFSNIVSAGCPFSNPTLADIDNDGFIEIVLTGGGKVFAYRYNGIPLNEFPILIEQGFEQQSYPAPILVDLDGNDKVEIIVGTMNNRVVAYNYQGKLVKDFPLSISGSSVIAPTIANLNDENKFSLLTRSNDDFCYIWKLDYNFNAEGIYWGEYLKDSKHSSLYLHETSLPSKEGSLMPEKTVYNYPNPTEGKSTTIRYYLRDAAEVTIRIYDMAGELVEAFPGPGFPNIDNEVNWDITNIESGIYLTRIQAKSESETNVAIIKIAVVK